MAMAMSTQAKGLLLFLAVVTYASGARGVKYTYISNQASRAIVATTSYRNGNSQFINRVIDPGTNQRDEYNVVGTIHVELWVNGAGVHSSVNIAPDRSLVAYDHAAGSTGVDIYLVKYGTLLQNEGPVLTTIYLIP